MLWFVGIGISGASSAPSGALDIIKSADLVYLETFTSPIVQEMVSWLEGMTAGSLKIAKRWMVEDGSEILANAKTKTVVLVSYGDPYIATTHIELRVRAMSDGIKTATIHGSSAVTSMIGECGLHHYKTGRPATIMNDPKSMTTPYYTILRNLLDGSHTILLLEYDESKKFFLEPAGALELLLGAERGQKRRVIDESTFVIVASRIGSESQKITAGTVSHIMGADLGDAPHTIIVPGSLHFTESDALRVLAECLDEPAGNSGRTASISSQMIKKYAPAILEAAKEMSLLYKDSKAHQEILDNARRYVSDAQKALDERQDEVAVLSIGYADGLVDALRIAKGLDPKM